MEKTNYDVIMENMTIDKLTELINGNHMWNPCRYCIYKDSECSAFYCTKGIKRWLERKHV